MRVLRDLRERRVAPTLADEAVEQAFKDTDEMEQIQAFLHVSSAMSIWASYCRKRRSCSPPIGGCAMQDSVPARRSACLKRICDPSRSTRG